MALHNIGQALRALDACATPFVGLPSTLPNDQDVPIWRGKAEHGEVAPFFARALVLAPSAHARLTAMPHLAQCQQAWERLVAAVWESAPLTRKDKFLIRRESSTGIPAWAMTLHTATQSFYSLEMMESALLSYVETAGLHVYAEPPKKPMRYGVVPLRPAPLLRALRAFQGFYL